MSNNKLLKAFSFVFLIAIVTNVDSSIKVDANEGEIQIEGEIKDVVVARFPKKRIKLFQDNGNEANEKDRTYEFKIIRLTTPGAKLKLSAYQDISYNNGTWSISKQNEDGSLDIFDLKFALFGPSTNKNQIQREWKADQDGYYYTLNEEDNVGTWSIVAKLITPIEKQKAGKFVGYLKISVVAD